jgi:Dynamitin
MEVFESDNVVGNVGLVYDEPNMNNDVDAAPDQLDESPMSTSAAFERFTSDQNGALDFQKRAAALPSESAAERLQRLQKEIADLGEQIERNGAQEEQDAESNGKAQVATLHAELDSLANRLHRHRSAQQIQEIGSISAELVHAPTSPSSSSSNDDESRHRSFVRVEERLALLERVLGAERDGMQAAAATTQHGLVGAVHELETRLAALDEAKLAKVETRAGALVGTLSAQQQRLAETSVDAEAVQRVEALHALMMRWDSVAADLPAIARRLHSLKAVHDSSISFGDDLAALEQTAALARQLLADNQSLLEQVQSGFAANLESIQSNFATIQARIDRLEQA